jgi:NhaP-type Na+/H+ or K+/H+ antiporter
MFELPLILLLLFANKWVVDDAKTSSCSQFAGSLFGSIGIGLGCGFCCTVYFWALRGRQSAVTEVMIFFCWAFIPYYISDGLGCSGIISIMCMGFMMDFFVIGGFQSEEVAWSDYMQLRPVNENNGVMNPNHPPEDRYAQTRMAFSQAFSGRGHILSRSRHHVGFVAQVIALLMDTAIFAYLGLFLFNDNNSNIWLNVTAILGCVSSRAVMVVVLSFFINLFVYLDVESSVGRLFRHIRRGGRVSFQDDDDSSGNNERKYLDKRTQLILLLAGVRGAVSFALVENIPVYDAVTKTGSKFKPELKAMTSSAIVFTLFIFGALTYFTVQHGAAPNQRESRVAGSLTHRLMSEPLDSDDELQSCSDIASSTLEIDTPLTANGFNSMRSSPERQYCAPHELQLQSNMGNMG